MIVPPMMRAPFLSGLGSKSRGLKPSGAAWVSSSVVGATWSGAAGGAGGRAVRVREQALLGRHGAVAAASGAVSSAWPAAPSERPSRGLADSCSARPLPSRLERSFGRRVGRLDVAEVAVGVRVAVDVLDHHELAEALALADLDDLAVVDGDDRGALAGEDVDAAAGLVGLHDHRGVAGLDLVALLVELARVGRLGVDREAALREARERADEVARQAADDLGAHQHGVDVPVGVVVGEDGAADVAVGAGGLEVARGGEDRVDRVERVLDAVAVGVDAVGGPRRRHELHPAEGARGGDVQVAAVVGLDLVDRGEDLPAHAVLHAGGLVDREEEGRDPELVDEEVRDADSSRSDGRDRVARVGRRG